MKQISIIALLVSALMVAPTMASAKQHKKGYKPYSEKSFKKAGNQNNKGQRKRAGKNVGGNKKTTGWKKANNKSRAYHHKKKDSKSRKFKRILKKSLKAFGGLAIDQYNKGHRGNHRNNYHYENRYYDDDYCLPRRAMRARLIDRGWHDFEFLNRGANRIRLLATNYKGRRFRLVLDNCTGEVIKRRPLRRIWGGGY